MEDKTSSSIFSGAKSGTPDTIRRISDAEPKSMASKPRDSNTSLSSTTKKLPTRAASASSSPFASRESSPVRPPLKSNSSSARPSGPGRSRKNSVQDISPSRAAGNTNTNPPSAAATQRALSSTSTPSLYPAHTESAFKAPVPPKAISTTEIRETPRWPLSPRLRSPPPSNKHSIISPRKADPDYPSINVPRTEEQEGKQPAADIESEDLLSISGMRTPARGASGSTLETVQEISLPNTPGLGLDGLSEKAHNGRLAEQDTIENAFNKNAKSKGSIGANESGSESGGKSDTKLRSASLAPVASSRPGAPPVKSYSATIGAGRGKSTSDGTTRNMTVETETVSSIPQVAVGGNGGGNNGSLRTKPSSETIRPKKEKKKMARKAPSVNAGTASSKADIFEAKVASAVDEANSTDSEETFVYESNPPDNNDRSRRFHSRTPSVTSMASQADQRNGLRSMMDTGHSVAMKKSMKFANSYSSNTPEVTATEDDGKGTARSNMGTGRGTTHHHHIGRWGRNGGNGHPSLFDNESPFPNAAKSKMASNGNGNGARNTSQPSSPRAASRAALYGGKKSSPISSGYDMDDGADDERTPLISTVRSGRSGRTRRPASSLRQLEHQAARQNRSFFARFAGCIVISLMVVMVFFGAIGFMFATAQPLTEVSISGLKNVLVSQEEIIFDMQVMARNKNIVVVTIETCDLEVFAHSKYAGTKNEWWKWQTGTQNGAKDDDQPQAIPPLFLGKIFEFKSPLSFDGSPFYHLHSTSKGQLRLSKPGNQTTQAGFDRWERIIQHEFEFIIQGVLNYTLPLTQKVTSADVIGRVVVTPSTLDQDPGTPRSPPTISVEDFRIKG